MIVFNATKLRRTCIESYHKIIFAVGTSMYGLWESCVQILVGVNMHTELNSK